METAQLMAYVIAAGLLVLAWYFGRQQLLSLRQLRTDAAVSPEDRRYARNQAWLRLGCCGLMLVLAGLVAGAYASGMEHRATELGRAIQAQRDRGEEVQLTPEQQAFRRLWASYWIAVLLLLLVILILAGIDIVGIWRYRRRHLREIAAERREVIQEQVAILRSRRNGHQN
jgi:cytochrome bd-type quinol oxidase subunit 2